jgi:hypothetical protein
MDVVRRLLGEEPARAEPGRSSEPSPQHRSVGTNAEATADPHRFVLMQPMLSDGIVVKIIARGGRGEGSDLTRGRDFLYDPELGEIVLFGELRVDPGTQLLFVSGQIRDPSRFFFHRALAKEDVKVVLNDRRLVLGKDFDVAERDGVVHILAADIGAPQAKFFVSAGDHSMSNGVDMRRVRELLDQGR